MLLPFLFNQHTVIFIFLLTIFLDLKWIMELLHHLVDESVNHCRFGLTVCMHTAFLTLNLRMKMLENWKWWYTVNWWMVQVEDKRLQRFGGNMTGVAWYKGIGNCLSSPKSIKLLLKLQCHFLGYIFLICWIQKIWFASPQLMLDICSGVM